MPHRQAASIRLCALALLAYGASARASWAEIDLHTYDTIDFPLGVANAATTLCEMPLVATLLLPEEPSDGDGPRSCEDGMQRVLEDHFNDDMCRQGGLYISALEACLDAIAGAMHDHHRSSHDPNILAPAFGDVIAEHCSASDICRHPEPLGSGP